ncbi:gamma-glutamyltransferase [Siphonobacter aquaeclarae]|uniref:Glutathione hydrolase proenzyme n=1 Tax=Siphonobacter aquaeclarae TaxID=563176 RepID=A0A1G9N9Y8_9BACT|nr:gamma-glutamyltransferase [Siphonobacter aquaeclarae]SDL83131.1 gamma-glutamyltranspeptidase / glutathione hydrolase [Siphonobacter aquaeclarae]
MRYLSFVVLFVLLAVAGCRKNPSASKGAYTFITDDPGAKPFISDKKGVFQPHVMAASAHPEASKVGAAIMKKGGNAVDAAVATFFALSVVHPSAGNLGGGGFMVFRDKSGQSFALDFREKAPYAASRDMYLDEKGDVVPNMAWLGHSASGVPGSVDGMAVAHQRFGKLSWKEVIQPAIELAENGVALTDDEAKGLNRVRSDIRKFNPGEPYFLKAGVDTVWKTGELHVQADLGKTLRRIQEKGRAGFYEGETAQLLIAEMAKAKAPIVQKDLDDYHSAWRTPITGTYRGYKVISMSPTSSGGIALVQLMKLVEPYPLKKWGWHSDSTTQVIIEAERRVYADRAKWLGDPDFFKVPAKELLEPAYLAKRWSDFDWNKASDSKAISGGAIPGYESNETTHLSVVDAEGAAVSITTTINNGYGSRVVVNGAGFLMNDEMEDFAVKPGVPNVFGLVGAEANSVQPGKRMLSSMTPTILEKDGKLFMVVGTPGGSTIITSVFQTIVNVIDHGMSMQEAVNALKFHHQWLPDRTTFEQGAFSEKVLAKLRSKGYKIEPQAGTLGRMDCILVLPDGTLEGGSDPRGDDTSVGW